MVRFPESDVSRVSRSPKDDLVYGLRERAERMEELGQIPSRLCQLEVGVAPEKKEPGK